VAGRAQAAGDFGDMGGADLAAAADDGGALCDPAKGKIGVVRRRHFGTGGKGVDGGAFLEELGSDLLEAVGIGAEGQGVGLQMREGLVHRLDIDADGIHLVWRETGGPAVLTPKCHGSGTEIIERAAMLIGGSVVRKFDPDGVRVDLLIPPDPAQ